MQVASIVSERFGFKLPPAYVRMTEAGLLSLESLSKSPAKKKAASLPKKPATSKAKSVYARARALAACDLHWLTGVEITAHIEKSKGRASRQPRWPADFVFVPFAESGAGDAWGWAPSLGGPTAPEPPILFIAHDTGDARVVAPTFATFLFRMTLESLARCPHEPSEMSLGERIAMLRGSARAVVDFLPAELSARLDRVLDLPVRKIVVRTLRERDGRFFRASDATSTHLSLVDNDWAARIVREELEDPRLDRPLRIDA